MCARCVHWGDFVDLPTYSTVKCMCLQPVGSRAPPPGRAAHTPTPPPSRRPPQVLADSLGRGVASGPVVVAPLGLAGCERYYHCTCCTVSPCSFTHVSLPPPPAQLVIESCHHHLRPPPPLFPMDAFTNEHSPSDLMNWVPGLGTEVLRYRTACPTNTWCSDRTFWGLCCSLDTGGRGCKCASSSQGTKESKAPDLFCALEMVNFVFTEYEYEMITCLNPLDALIPKIPFSLFADFWVWVTSEAQGSVSVGFRGSCQSFPRGVLPRGLYRPPPPPTPLESPPVHDRLPCSGLSSLSALPPPSLPPQGSIRRAVHRRRRGGGYLP